MSSGATRATTPISSTCRGELLVVERSELGAGQRAAVDPELRRDRGGGRRVVARDHPDADARLRAARDRVPRLAARRVDDPHEGEQRQVADVVEERPIAVERRRVEVPRGDRQDAQPLAREAVVLGEDAVAMVVDSGDRPVDVADPRRAGEQHVRRALDEAADDRAGRRPRARGTSP